MGEMIISLLKELDEGNLTVDYKHSVPTGLKAS